MTERTMAEVFDEALVSQTTRQIGALPVVYPILETLGLREVVNDLCYTRADIDLGRIAELLTLNRLLAPQPMYWVKRWASDTVLPEMLDMPVGKLYDNRLGRALDALHPFLGEIWARVAARAVTVYRVDLSIVHWDITSLKGSTRPASCCDVDTAVTNGLTPSKSTWGWMSATRTRFLSCTGCGRATRRMTKRQCPT